MIDEVMKMLCNTSTSVHVVDLVTTDQDKKYAPAGQMATAIIDTIYEQGTCLPQDLKKKGFSPEEVFKHWHMANALAIVEVNLLCEHSTNLKSIIRRK